MESNEKKKYNQNEYNKRYEEKNRERANYLKSRSATKSFIRNKSTLEDVEELRTLLEQREIELKGN